MYLREDTKVVKIKDRLLGGNNPVLIQSMTNTKTKDVDATVSQILELEKLGCEVIEAVNGREAITSVLEQEPDGVILDIVMPVVGGIEALEFIREVAPNVPVVMLSSMGTPQKLMQCLKMGAIDFINKPYTREQIIHTIERIKRLRTKRLEKAQAAAENPSEEF